MVSEARGPRRTIGKSDDDTHFVVGPKVSPLSCAGCSQLSFCEACNVETCHCLNECVGCLVRAGEKKPVGQLVSYAPAVGVVLSMLLTVGVLAWVLW